MFFAVSLKRDVWEKFFLGFNMGAQDGRCTYNVDDLSLSLLADSFLYKALGTMPARQLILSVGVASGIQ